MASPEPDPGPESAPGPEPASESAPPAEGWELLSTQVAALDQRLAAQDERARHRESVIDRLHSQNQELRSGERRSVLDPVVTDLIHLYEQLEREAGGLRERGEARLGDLLASLADDALLSLERAGVEPVEAAPGDPFQAELHRPLSTVEDPDPERAHTVARVAARGFRDAATGRVRRKVQAHFYRHVAPDTP